MPAPLEVPRRNPHPSAQRLGAGRRRSDVNLVQQWKLGGDTGVGTDVPELRSPSLPLVVRHAATLGMRATPITRAQRSGQHQSAIAL
jgi:hypothetical protein